MSGKEIDLIYCVCFGLSLLSRLRFWQHRLTGWQLKALCFPTSWSVLWQVVFFILVCVLELTETRSEAAAVWRGEYTVTGLQSSEPVFARLCGCRSDVNESNKQQSNFHIKFTPHFINNSTQEIYDGVINGGPGGHEASPSYSLISWWLMKLEHEAVVGSFSVFKLADSQLGRWMKSWSRLQVTKWPAGVTERHWARNGPRTSAARLRIGSVWEGHLQGNADPLCATQVCFACFAQVSFFLEPENRVAVIVLILTFGSFYNFYAIIICSSMFSPTKRLFELTVSWSQVIFSNRGIESLPPLWAGANQDLLLYELKIIKYFYLFH